MQHIAAPTAGERGSPLRRHLLDLDGFDWEALRSILAATERERTRLADPAAVCEELRGRRVATLFYEASTRTRLSFEIAARSLGAEVLSFSVATSSVVKGESLVDTVRTIRALGADILVLRHERSGAPWLAARTFDGSLINAGDGWHAHPTQALLDLAVLSRHLGDAEGSLRGRRIAIIGDLAHSRVVRSNLHALVVAGAEVRLAGPANLTDGFSAFADALTRDWERRGGDAVGSVRVVRSAELALDGADAAMALRIQRERLGAGSVDSLEEYRRIWGLTEERLSAHAASGCIVLHPGPMNEGVEIDAEVADGPRSVVLEQVATGVAVRAAVLSLAARGALPSARGVA